MPDNRHAPSPGSQTNDLHPDSRPHAVILAGGLGSRFWPASTPERPKQLLPLGSPQSLIEDTVERAAGLVGLDHVRILAGADLVRVFKRELPELTDEHFLVEPKAAGTAPILAWAAHCLCRNDPEALMISLHADHVIDPFDEFERTLETGLAAARQHHTLVCIGIHPQRPETGYGYIRLGREVSPGIHEVRRFEEKPDRTRASSFVASDEYVWNTGIFVWRAADFLEAIRRFTPEVHRAFEVLEAGDVEGFFEQVEPITVDVGVFERADNVQVVLASFHWDDVGAWGALARTRPGDSSGNHVIGACTFVDAEDNIVWSEDGRVVLYRVRDLVVVRSGEQTLVTTRDGAEEVKQLLARLETETRSEAEE